MREVKIFSNSFEQNGQQLLHLIIYDMTKRRRAEIAESDQRMLAEALRNTAAVLSSTLDQNEVLDRILEHLNLVVRSDCANIMLIEAGVARVVRSRGYNVEGRLALIQQIRLKVRETQDAQLDGRKQPGAGDPRY